MPEFDIQYPHGNATRIVKPGSRSIRSQMIAFELGEEYYDGSRENGYGGYGYDGRWKQMLPNIIEHYQLTENSSVLDLGCKKGFFMHDLKVLLPGIKIRGVENHPYPIAHAMPTIKDNISLAEYDHLPYNDNEFDFVFGFASIYMMNLKGVMNALREIERVGKGKSVITLGAYNTKEDLALFQEWTLLGTTILHVDEWLEVFNYTGYTGDYQFVTADTLHLVKG